MELRDLRYFCLTAEMEHVTNAADKLGVAQPFLTKVIRQIEEDVGGALFTKVGRRIKLNADGEVFYKNAKKVLADMERLYAEMDYVFDRKEQTITLMYNTEAFGPRLIRAFKEHNPHYSITFLHVSQQEMIDSLVNGDAEFAFCCPPIAATSNTEIVTEPKIGIRGCVLLPPNHRLLGQKSITLDDLRGEPFITMPKKSAMRNKLQSVFDYYDFHPKTVVEANNLNMLTQAVESGMGYAIITKLIIEDYPQLKPNCVDLDAEADIGYYALSYNKSTLENRNAKDFRDFFMKFLCDIRDFLAPEDTDFQL